jgi:hypothetical protein
MAMKDPRLADMNARKLNSEFSLRLEIRQYQCRFWINPCALGIVNLNQKGIQVPNREGMRVEDR